VVQDSGWPSVMVLVTDHGGRLDVQSVVMPGTTFNDQSANGRRC